ncbi:MAG: globin [Gammaproteobacteria bacterium]|nr:globin [Gammaproteobacteria bacterium]
MKRSNARSSSRVEKGRPHPDVYAAYFKRCPGSEALMSHIDNLVRGKMLNEVFRLMLEPSLLDESRYLDFEVDNHRRAYSVEPHMYGNLLAALKDTVRDLIIEDWTNEMDAAWQQRIDELLAEIEERHSSAT